MVKAYSEGLVTHEILANTMPFYCGWLVDVTDETKPCIASVPAGSALFSTQYNNLVPPKVWTN